MIANSRSVDVLVTGRSLPALLTALGFAEVGLSVAVAGGSVELPAAAERDPEGELAAFIERIAAPGAAVRQIEPRPPWLLDREDHWAPQPEPSVFGIPAVPLSQSSLRLLGTGGAMRAYRDRVAPLLTIGKTQSFGRLVRKRLGRAALERLVEPIVREQFGVDAEEVDAAIAAPGLNEALSRTGSLTSAALAYSERHVARETTVMPVDGWNALADATLKRLEFFDVELLDASVTGVETLEEGWVVSLAEAESEGEARFEVRAIVVDHPRRIGEWPDAMAMGGLQCEKPRRVRMHAEIDIQAPGGCDGAESISTDCSVAVQAVDDWSVRFEASAGHKGGRELREGATEWHAVLSGPIVESAVKAEGDVDLAKILEAAGGIAETQAGRQAESKAEWKAERRAAPYATIGQRDLAVASLNDLAVQRTDALRVGRSLHGDELAAALASAHAGAVTLRRHLLGLTD